MLVSRRILDCNNNYNSKTLVLGLCYTLAILVGYHPLLAFATPPERNHRSNLPGRNDDGGRMWAEGEDTGTKSIIIDVEDPQLLRCDTGTGTGTVTGWNWSSTLELTELKLEDRRATSTGPSTFTPTTVTTSNNYFTTPAMPIFSAIHRRRGTRRQTPKQIRLTNRTSNIGTPAVSSSPLFSVLARQQKRKRVLTSGLLSLSGIAESICFRKYGLYPTMMTGNTVKCITALSDFQWTTAGSIGTYILCYILGGTLYRFLDLWAAQRREHNHQTASYKERPPSSSPSSSPSARNLPWLARLALVLFVSSDFIAYKMQQGIAALPVMSLAYGLINAAALDEVGCATNAVTGHCTTMGLGFAEHILYTSWRSTSNSQKSRSSDLSSDANKNSKEKFTTSLQGTTTFVVAVFLTGLAYRWVAAQGSTMTGFLPPLGTSFGLAYLALMTWYVQH
jgi:uncharacterized membrane protein YoaK (UPF0700 family)